MKLIVVTGRLNNRTSNGGENEVKRIKFLFIGLLILSVGCGTNKSEGFSVIDSNVEFGQEDYKTIVNANNELGFNMLTTVEQDENHNVFISPTSLYMVLSMVYNGADGKTKEEMAETLQVQGINVEELNKANASLLSSLYKDTNLIELRIGNSLWLNDNYHFQKQFEKNAKNYFNGEIQEINMSDHKSPDKINKWVDKATNGKIEEIVEGPLSEDILAYLVNAVYFKGDWQYEFDKKATRREPFYLQDGTTKNVQLMKLEEELPYFETEDFQAVKLPYGDGEMSMSVFLPKEHVQLDQFIDQMKLDYWNEWTNEFREKEGTIFLPKFQLDYETSLNNALMDLGMSEAFEAGLANFSNMIEEDAQIFISDVKQKTYIDVNEEGTEAAGVTSVEMKLTSAPVDGPFYMNVNRPFFLTITDDETGAILFMGTINSPEE